MHILPFRNPLARRSLVEARDWSQQELADFYRAHRLLVENGVGIGIDRGISDTGDPWMAFFDVATQDVFLHVARIDRNCVLLCEQFGIRIVASNVTDLVQRFEDEVRHLLCRRQERNSNVVLHPAARIIMSISAIFLLFKFENSGTAHAKGADIALGANGDLASRKQDAGALARVHSAIGRLYDTMDTPAAVAALAGVILTIELSKLPSRPAATDHDDHAGVAVLVSADNSPHLVAGPEHGQGEIGAKSAAPIDIKIDVDVAKALPLADRAHATQPAQAHDEPHGGTPSSAPWGGTPLQSAAAARSDQDSAIQASVIIVAEQRSASPSEPAENTQAAKAVQVLLPQIAALDSDNAPAGQPATDHSVRLPEGIGEISLATLSELDSVVGLLRTTELSGALLTEKLSQFLVAFGQYEVELAGSGVLIEQGHIAGLDGHDLGLWTNVMADGSEIAVVGQIGVIDTITATV